MASARAGDDRQAGSMLRRLGRLAGGCLTGFVILSLLLAMLYRSAPPPVTPLMLLRLAEGYAIHKSWRPLDDISPALIRAVMASEESALLPAFRLRLGRNRSGVGTIPNRGRRPAGSQHDLDADREECLSVAGPELAAQGA